MCQSYVWSCVALGLALSVQGCGSSDKGSASGSDGAAGGAVSTGGVTGSSGATASGGASTGGATASGGASTGGAAASGGSSGGGNIEGPLACNYAADFNCQQFSSAPPNAASAYCLMGSTVETACPTANIYATCTFMSSGIDEEFFYYQGGSYTKTNVKVACDAENGTLTFAP